jgi:hypothetical protein
MHRQLPRHRDLRDLSSSAHGKVEEATAPLRLTLYRDLRRFHQQKSQQSVALFADVCQTGRSPHQLIKEGGQGSQRSLFPTTLGWA